MRRFRFPSIGLACHQRRSSIAPDTTAPTITSANPSGGYAEMVPVSGTLTANEAVTWSKSGADAARVTLNPATGAWSLETTDFETKASYAWTFTATDLALNATDQVVAITITNVDESAFSTTGSPAVGQWGTAYSDSGITATGGTSPYNVSGLPSGLSGSFSGGTLTISGTPA